MQCKVKSTMQEGETGSLSYFKVEILESYATLHPSTLITLFPTDIMVLTS